MNIYQHINSKISEEISQYVGRRFGLFITNRGNKQGEFIMKRYYIFLVIFVISIISFNISAEAQLVYYVGNGGTWENWDIYSFDVSNGIETRLTTNTAIDNHPSISHYDTSRIAFSSTRDGGEFDIYVADADDIENTAVRLTFNNDYPDRHPHWHPNGDLIIYTSKDRPVTTMHILATECSEPIITFETRYYEGLNLIDLNNPGTVLPLDIVTAWDNTTYPNIWIFGDSIYVGHPSFNHQGDLMVFTAAIDGEGKNWEVYTAGFDPINNGLIPNSLRRITHGPNVGSNPIKMSGGASFSHDDSEIIFNSTRITGGNSQIFSVPVTSNNLVLHESYRRTWHHGNDYVPEPLENGDIVISSDLGPQAICECDAEPGATDDLDVVLLDKDDYASRTILGNDDSQETLLLADEVSWFCGLKPNLTQCTFQPRIFSVESLWLEFHPYELLFPDLLAGYGEAYSNNAMMMYEEGWMNISDYLMEVNPGLLDQLYNDMTMLWNGFPGWNDPGLLENWLDATAQTRRIKYVVPSIMHGVGLGDSCSFVDTLTGIQEQISGKSFVLQQNAPNPFNQITTISYELAEDGHVQLMVYDILGKSVATLVEKDQTTGIYSIDFGKGDLEEGIYFYSMKVNNSFQIKKMILLR